MKLFYKDQPVENNKELLAELEFPGAEFIQILYEKISSIEKNLKIFCIEGNINDGSKKQLFVLIEPNENIKKYYMSADGVCSLSKYAIERFESEYGLKNIEVKESSIQVLESRVAPSTYEKAYEVLKDFYLINTDKKVEDKLGNKYRLVIISNSDMTIGEHLHVDELMLFDGDKKIGYLKAKYTTDDIMKLHGVEKDNFFLNQATVDYSKLTDEYKNKGLGYIMYFHMSQHLSKKGIEFRQSTLCSDEAQLLWSGINRHWQENVQTRQMKSGSKNVNVLFLSIGEESMLAFENNKPVINKKSLK